MKKESPNQFCYKGMRYPNTKHWDIKRRTTTFHSSLDPASFGAKSLTETSGREFRQDPGQSGWYIAFSCSTVLVGKKIRAETPQEPRLVLPTGIFWTVGIPTPTPII